MGFIPEKQGWFDTTYYINILRKKIMIILINTERAVTKSSTHSRFKKEKLIKVSSASILMETCFPTEVRNKAKWPHLATVIW